MLRRHGNVNLASCGVTQIHDMVARRGTGLDDKVAAAGRHRAAEGVIDDLARPLLSASMSS